MFKAINQLHLGAINTIYHMNTLDAFQEKVNNARALDFGTIITESIELFKKVWLKGFLIVLILVASAFGLSMLLVLIGLGPETYLFNYNFNSDEIFRFYSKNALYNIPQTILISSLAIALLGAFYKICKEEETGKNLNDDYFYFFKREYRGKILMLGIIHALIATVAQILFLIPYIYVFVPLSYFSIVFANNPNLTEIEIVKASFSLGNKKWLITFGTMIVTSILGMLGFLVCGIGVLFTISIAYLPVYLIYREVIGFGHKNEIDLTGKNDI